MRYLFSFIFVVSTFLGWSQGIGLGTWRSHLSYRQVEDIQINTNHAVVRSAGGIYTYQLQGGEITRYSSVNGLRRAAITAMDELPDGFIVGYENGALDLVGANGIKQIDDIKNSGFEDSKKGITNINQNGNRITISTGFGVVVLNRSDLKVISTYWQLGELGQELEVFQALENSSTIAVATQAGLITGTIGENLQDFSNWNRYPTVGIPNKLAKINETLYASVPGEGLYEFDGNDWTKVAYDGETIVSLNSGDELGICTELNCDFWTTQGSSPVNYSGNALLSSVTKDGSDQYLGTSLGMYRITGIGTELIVPSGPFSPQTFTLNYQDGAIYALAGGYDNFFQALNSTNGLYQFKEESWVNLNGEENPIYLSMVDPIDMVSIPGTESKIIASYEGGLLELTPEETLSPYNNPIGTGRPITGIHYDGELWVVVADDSQPLRKQRSDGGWEAFSIENAPPLYSKEILSDGLFVYILIHPEAGNGVVIFDKSTGQSRVINEQRNEGDLPGIATSIALDRRGELWIGTNNGVAYIPAPTISEPINAFTPILEFVPLLRGTLINDIKVDGGNRKWISTDEGVWLMEEGGEEVVHQFTVNNSPLLSNEVFNAAINGATGEVFFNTSTGIISFRSDGTNPSATHSNVKIFPNPVLPSFKGMVGISGLVGDASVKITDVNGKLVYETQANGGTASWDLVTYSGKTPGTSIYFVFTSNEDGSETFVGKIAVIR